MITLERTIELYLIGSVESAGGECLKWTGARGVPDRLVFLNGAVIPVEVKSPTGKLADHQVRMHKRLSMTGSTVYTVATKEHVDDLVYALTEEGLCYCKHYINRRRMN